MIGNLNYFFFIFRSINNTKAHMYAENKLHLFNPKIIIIIIMEIIIIIIINFVIYTKILSQNRQDI